MMKSAYRKWLNQQNCLITTAQARFGERAFKAGAAHRATRRRARKTKA